MMRAQLRCRGFGRKGAVTHTTGNAISLYVFIVICLMFSIEVTGRTVYDATCLFIYSHGRLMVLTTNIGRSGFEK